MIRKSLLLFCLFVACQCVYAQRTHSLELKFYGGSTIPHRSGMGSLLHTTAGGELNYYFSTRSDDFYDVKYRYPQHGFGLNYNYLGSPDVLGSAIAAYSFMDIDMFSNEHFRLGTRINAGLAYLTRRYDRIENPENIAVSTPICFYFSFGFNFAFRLPAGFELKLMPMFMHYSNGAVRKPNLGLNQAVLSLAVSKDIAQREYTKERRNYVEGLSPHEAWAFGTCVSSDEYSVGYNGRGGGFICSTGAVGYSYQYGKIGKVGASLDMFYNENLKYYFDERNNVLVQQYEKFGDVVRLGFCVGHQLVYRRFELVSYVGMYVYNKVKKNDWFYTRIGGRYYVTNFMFVNLTLKAMGFKAHFIECGLGFSCRKWKKD